jgi:methionyl-tRNA formyltransferase
MIPYVFFGTPRFATIVLDELERAGLPPSAVVTQPAKPKGRHLVLTPSETETWARERGIPVLAPERIRGNETFMEELSRINARCFVVAAYGNMLPKTLLDLAPHGTLNVHPSLLPKYRGASPIESQILSDERDIGVTIILMDEELDHGPILSAKRIERPEPWPAKGTVLTEILAREGGKLLAETLPRWLNGKITPIEQDHQRATYTRKIEKSDGLIELSADPMENLRKIRAYDEWPGAFTMVKRRGQRIRVKITEASIIDGKLSLTRVIPEGKREMAFQDFLRG